MPTSTPDPTDTASAPTPVLHLPLSLIDEHPENPRVVSWNLDELVASIRTQGVVTPCLVRSMRGGDRPHRFQLIAGHRRKRAAEMAGLSSLPCLVLKVPDSDVWAFMLSENVQREQLNPIEEANFYSILRARGLTILAISKRLGCSEPRVSRYLGLLDLSPNEQRLVLSGELSMKEAWDLARSRKPRKGPPPGSPEAGRSTKWNEHFNQQHPHASEAEALCDEAGHEVPSRLGPACGFCWEEAIRDDQHLTTQWEVFGEDDPDQILPRDEASA